MTTKSAIRDAREEDQNGFERRAIIACWRLVRDFTDDSVGGKPFDSALAIG